MIDISGTPLENNGLVGQAFGVIAPGDDENGHPNKARLYSLACPSYGDDGEGKVISTTTKRVIDERVAKKRAMTSTTTLYFSESAVTICAISAPEMISR